MRFDMAWFETLKPQMAGDPLYAWIGRYFTARILFEEDGRSAIVRLSEGRLTEVRVSPPLMCPWAIALRGDETAWGDLLAAVPRPGCQSVFALAKVGRMRVEGDWLVLMQNLWAFTRLVELMRAHEAGGSRAAA
jgi:hypothetical protein